MVLVYLLLIVLSFCDMFYLEGAEDSSGRWYDVLFLLIDPGEGSSSVFSHFALAVSILGMIVFSGMLISVISNVLERRVERFVAGETSYTLSEHIIVIGFNKSLPSLLQTINLDFPKSFIVVLCDRDVERVRDLIHANVGPTVEEKLIVLNGSLTATDDLKRLCFNNNPQKIYVLGEEGRNDHDAEVLTCVNKISSLLPACESKDAKSGIGASKPQCLVQIDSVDSFTLLQQSDFTTTENIKNLTFFPFNFCEIWAQKALGISNFGNDDFRPLDGNGISPESSKRVHMVIAGLNDMGKALALNAAHVLHFPNFKEGDFKTYSRITFISSDIKREGERFRTRYSTLFQLARWRVELGDWIDPLADPDSDSPYRHLGPPNFMDIEWEFLEGELSDPHICGYLREIAIDPDSISNLALCGDDSEANLSYAMGLPEDVLHKFNMVLIRQKYSDIGVKLIAGIPGKSSILKPFGKMTECYRENLLTDEYGKMVNALYINKNGISNLDFERNRDLVEEWWRESSITDKWSSNYSANSLFVKLRSMGFNRHNISKEGIEKKLKNDAVNEWMQKTEHNRWNLEKILLGFTPLTLKEQQGFEPFRQDSEKTKDKRKAMAAAHKKHLDICSNETLKVIDKKMAEVDNIVTSRLWDFFEKSQKSKK